MPTGKNVELRPAVQAPLRKTSLVASATRYGDTGTRFKDYSVLSAKSNTEAWQTEAWRFYRIIGEFRYAADWVGSMLSKALIFATEYKDGRTVRVDSTHAGQRIVDETFNNPDGRAEMFRLFGIHFTVAGECWSVTYPDPNKDDESDYWELVAPQNIKNVGDQEKPIWQLHGKPLDPRINPAEVLVVRYWRPDPLNPDRAIAPALGVLSYLGEIERASQHIAAQMDSRLAGAGIILMPDTISLPTPPDAEGKTVRANSADELMALLANTMALSLSNKGSAASKVPMVILAKAEDIEAARHMKFWSDLDEKAMEMRNDAVRKLAVGLDMPPEVLQGVSESNQWSAWQADESAIKAHTEPLLKIITSALAEGVLRPALRAELPKGTAFDNFSIEADTSEMRLRPNRSKEALELYDLGILNRKAVLRETGFHEDDLMSPEEEVDWFTRKVASGQTTPEIVAAALDKLGVTLVTAAPVDDGEVHEARPTPSLEQHPTRELPDRGVGERRREARQEGRVPSSQPENRDYSALVAAADMVVIRALERAGNKLKVKMRIGDGATITAAADLYRMAAPALVDPEVLLDDAWAHVPVMAERMGHNPSQIRVVLEDYCRDLLVRREPHDYGRFEKYITDRMEGLA